MKCIGLFKYSSKSARFFILCSAITAWGANTLTLNISSATDTVNKALYGALMENNWGRCVYKGVYVGESSAIPNTNGIRNDIIRAFKEAGIFCLEWPGGCNAESYIWTDGIGTKSSRSGGEMVNGLGTDEYMQLCDSLGALPYICCNMTSDSAASSAKWLNYIDSFYPNKMKYWKIGNEVWGGCSNTSLAVVGTYMAAFEKFVKAIPSKFTKLFVIGQASRDTDAQPYAWSDSMMNRELANFDGLSFHFYAVKSWSSGQKGSSFDFTESEYYTLLQKAYILESYIKANETVMDKYDPSVTKGLMIDEWGAWYEQISGMGTTFQQSTVRDAQIASMSFNMFINHCKRVKMALVAQAVNAIQALILTKNSTTDSSMIKTPTYYVFKMYKVHQNAKMVPGTLSCSINQSIPVISQSSSIDSTGKLHISLANTHATTAQSITVTLNGGATYSTVTGQIINGTTITSHNGFDSAENVNIQNFSSDSFKLNGTTLTVNLPAHSVVTLELSSATGVYQYNKKILGNMGTDFIVKYMADGSIAVEYSSRVSVPVFLAVYNLNGRMIGRPFTSTLKAGNKRIVWHPAGIDAGNIYIVKVTAGDIIKVQRMALAR